MTSYNMYEISHCGDLGIKMDDPSSKPLAK